MTTRTASEIAAELFGVNMEIDNLKGKARGLSAELREAQAQEAATAKVAAMSPEERAAALAQLEAMASAEKA